MRTVAVAAVLRDRAMLGAICAACGTTPFPFHGQSAKHVNPVNIDADWKTTTMLKLVDRRMIRSIGTHEIQKDQLLLLWVSQIALRL